MKRFSSIYINNRNFTFLGVAILLTIITAIYVLSQSINKTSEDNYNLVTYKNYHLKLTTLEKEFEKIDNYLNSLDSLILNSTEEDLSVKFKAINELYNPMGLIDINWYVILNKDGKVDESQLGGIPLPILDEVLLSHQDNNPSIVNDIIDYQDKKYWLLHHKRKFNNGNKNIIYGLSIDLEMLHSYLSNTDDYIPNYAYIFTTEGLCIYHPDSELIGKNVFSSTSIISHDTIHSTFPKHATIVESEYLKLDVIRYLDQFSTPHFKGYISINFPKVNMDENIEPIKENTYLIFIISITLISILFFLFILATRRAYKEKELLAVENEKINKENILIQLQQLKSQINPHYLFNSLNSLYMLIDQQPTVAKAFTLNLSKTYRYLISPPKDNLAELTDELTFIQQYIDLQKIRFSEALHVDLTIKSNDALVKKIPFLALQITVENALKHNIATVQTPLLIQIIVEQNNLLITNNLQPKNESDENEHFGLTYLSSIYKYYNKPTFLAQKKQDTFVCILPLINC